MPYSIKYDFLIFLHESFEFSDSFTLKNPAFIFIFTLFFLYCFLVIFSLYRSKKNSSENPEPDENMKKILEDYRKEIFDLSQQNATSFISLSTESHNLGYKTGESYSLKFNAQETELKTLPGDSNPVKELDFKDISLISQNPNNVSMIHDQKSHDSKDHPLENSKTNEDNENFSKPKEEISKKEEKRVMVPPTFTDRFDVIHNNLKKEESHSKPSINLQFTINTPEDMNVKINCSPSYNKSPKFEKNQIKSSFRKKKRVRHNVNSKFKQIIKVSNPFFSTYLKESRFFPKHLRVTLIYFEIIFCLFLTTLTVIKEENSRVTNLFNLFICSFFVSFLAWGMFLCLTLILTTDKQKLMLAKNDEDFYFALMNFEKEYKYRTLCGYLIINASNFMFYVQILAFCTVLKWETVALWLGINVIIIVSQHFFLDLIYYFLFSSIYVQAYDSKTCKQIYKVLRSLRVWIV